MSRFSKSNRHAAKQMGQIRHRRPPHLPAFTLTRQDCLALEASDR